MIHGKIFIFITAIALMAAAAFGQTLTVLSPNGGERWTLGDPVSIAWTATGVGGDLRINLYRSSGALVGTIANAVPAAAGNYSWTAGALAGGSAPAGVDYVVRLRAIGSDIMDSSNAAFALNGPLPNIRCTSMRDIGWDHTFLPRVFTAGESVTIKYHLQNDRTTNAGPFHVGLRLGGSIIARNAYTGLVSGDTFSGEFVWTAVCGSPLAVVADCDGEVAESDEGDNVMTDGGLACSLPDLHFFTALACSSGGTTPRAGMRYNFRAQVDATPVRAESVRVVGGLVGGAVLYDHTFPVLLGDGGIEDVEFTWEVPEGSQRLYFEIDPENRVAESNEGNNRQELAITGVAASPAGESYDLSVSITSPGRMFAPRARAMEAQLGKPLTVRGEVRGATGALRDFKVRAMLLAKAAAPVVVFEQDFSDPGMLAVPFSFTWTPGKLGDCTLSIQASLGTHAVAAGVVDGVPGNNTATLNFTVIKPKATLR